ncbi:MAG: ATP-binding cassette domain-containing protein, partial [Oscillospiraceae bacterium]|nr:ATP-binding cassette domain-containing protein [Oscillospiraceae bacterium]
STNGIFVNGARIERGCEITAKDEIYVASVRLRLKDGLLVPDETVGGLSVQVRNLYREVPDGSGKVKTLLDHVTLSIGSNEFVAVIGGSGAGKSTFTNVLCGKTAPSAFKGHVGFNDSPADSRGMYKSVIGYAPQNDILYHDLTLFQMLYYSAKLKMPQDAKQGEYEDRVRYVIQKVELQGHENTLVKKLSGGQQKRASIAVELLSDPKLFFLDEPTSGLDPATERKLMRMLKDMTRDNKTIIAVTHVTQNLSLCDKVIVLGKGGKLCFFGTPQDACAFFEVTDIVDVYDKINDDPAAWRLKFQEVRRSEGIYTGSETSGAAAPDAAQKAKKDKKAGYNSGWGQYLTLSARYIRLTFGDPKRCMLLLLQAPILGILLMLVSTSSSDGNVFLYSTSAKSMLFSLTCAAFWVGMLNSIQEICKEKDIFAREKMSTVRMLPYIASKVSVIGVLCIFQAFILVLIVQLFAGMPESVMGIQPFLGFFVTACLTTVSAACLGLAVSSLSPNPDRAMAIAPIILLPQILFSGVVFELSGFMKFISGIIPCKLSMQNFGTLSNFNALSASADVESKALDSMYSITNSANVFGTWRGLIISSIVYIAIFAIALRLKTKES